MGHPKRHDEPGSWHHLMNRGIGQRTLFEGDEDARGFLALLAKVAREGLLEPIAFCLLPNHFHLLAVSPEGRLGEAMQYLEGVYGRGFNRRRGRDGGLVRARYRSKLVKSDAYRRALVGYIDQNPIDAKASRTLATTRMAAPGSTRSRRDLHGWAEDGSRTSHVDSPDYRPSGRRHTTPRSVARPGPRGAAGSGPRSRTAASTTPRLTTYSPLLRNTSDDGSTSARCSRTG